MRETGGRSSEAVSVILVVVVEVVVITELEWQDDGTVNGDREPTMTATKHDDADDKLGQRS